MPDRIPKFEETQPLPEVPRFEDTQPVDIPRFEDTEPAEALPSFDQTNDPTVRDEIRAAIPEIVQQLRQSTIQPPQLGEFSPRELSQIRQTGDKTLSDMVMGEESLTERFQGPRPEPILREPSPLARTVDAPLEPELRQGNPSIDLLRRQGVIRGEERQDLGLFERGARTAAGTAGQMVVGAGRTGEMIGKGYQELAKVAGDNAALDMIGKLAERAGQATAGAGRAVAEKMAYEDPGNFDKAVGALSSIATFFVPGIGISKVAQALSFAPKLANAFGLTSAALMESSLESGLAFEDAVNEGRTEDEAQEVAKKVFMANIPITVIGNKLGVFANADSMAGKVARSYLAEGTQEAAQEASVNIAAGRRRGEGVGKAFVFGGLAGGVAGAAQRLMTPRQQAQPQGQPPAPPPATAEQIEGVAQEMPAPGPQMPAEAAPVRPAPVAQPEAPPRFEATQPPQEDLFPEAPAATGRTEAFNALPEKSRQRFNQEWQGQNVEGMKELLHPGNKALRAEFEARAGVKLPRGAKATKTYLDGFAVVNAERAKRNAALIAEKEAQIAANEAKIAKVETPTAEPAKEFPKDVAGIQEPPIPPTPPTDKPEPLPEMDPAQKLRKALAEAKPIRAEQELMYSEERANRFTAASRAYSEAGGGVDGFHAALGQLKGPLEKKAFESLGRMITQKDSDELVDIIFKSPNLKTMGDRLSATKGLQVLLQGGLPQEGQIAKLEKVFGKELIDEIQRKKPTLKQVYEMGLQIANIPRSLMASMDISAPFRQGLWTIGRKEFWGEAWPEMIKLLRSEKNFNELMTIIENDPDYPLLKDAGLDITGMAAVLEREEKFMSPIIERSFSVAGINVNIPGRIVRASGRAYVGFLNKLRLDVAKSMMKDAEAMGYKLTGDQVKRIVTYVNSATGRGPLGKLSGAADALNAVFFSPRLMASRVDMLTKAFRPSFYEKQNEFIRKQYWRDLMSVFGFGSSVLALAVMAGADIGDDPRSSDFGKIIIGNTRLDVWGGFQQYARMVGQLVTGEYRSSVTGKILTLGEGYKPLSRWDILWRQIEAKESPVASFIVKMMKQQDWEGKPVSARKEILERVWPLALRDIVDVAQDNPKILPISALGLVGFGSQTYKSDRPIDHRRMAQTMSFKDLNKTLDITTDRRAARAYYRAARKKFPEAMKKADPEGKRKLRAELNKMKSDYARRFKAQP